MQKRQDIRLFFRGITNSYSQIFFSDSIFFAVTLMVVSFFDIYAGLAGLISVLLTNLLAWWIGFDRHKIARGYYGFNSFLVGTGLGLYFAPGPEFYGLLVFTAILTLIISVTTEGVVGKYSLPNLSLPFVFSLWLAMLATRSFDALGISERWIYSLNDLYAIGGKQLVEIYEWWNNIPLPKSLKTYFYSLGAIVFQYNLLSGILIATGLLIYSRIAFTLSVMGFATAYLFYSLIGIPITETAYSYIGFNYILTAIAIGGYFLVPSFRTYLWVVLIIPVVAIFTISFSSLLGVFNLPAYALPFNIAVLMFLYTLKFRANKLDKLQEVIIQQNKPERNLYSFKNHQNRFRKAPVIDILLPFHGKWLVTQGYEGDFTHKNEWKHALDFEISDDNGKTFRGEGNVVEDYYCYGKNVLAPAAGIIEEVADGIPDNLVGQENYDDNWGNTIIIRHGDYIYSKLSHLKQGSIQVKKGERVTTGQVLAKTGNSGRSPVPHLHFQMQATPYIGSRTIDYPLASYIKKNHKDKLRCFTVPEKGELVENINPAEALKKAFYLVPGKRMEFTETTDKQEKTHRWDTYQDIYGRSCIYCKETNSTAYYRYNERLLVFEHFNGDRNSALYHFYLAAYRIQTGIYEGLKITDQYPVNTLFRRSPLLFMQDFAAPFVIFLKTRYVMKYVKAREDFLNTEVVLESKALAALGKKVLNITHYRFIVNDKGLKHFEISSGKTKRILICTNN